MPLQILTSTNNPLLIAELPMRTGGGMMGITFAPGKKQPDSFSGHHDRDLGADLDRIAAWNAAIVVTLMEAHELDKVAIANIGAEVRLLNMFGVQAKPAAHRLGPGHELRPTGLQLRIVDQQLE